MTLATPYYDEGGITIYHGDCRDLLPTIAAVAIVTDPPYGIGWTRSLNAARGSKAHAGIVNDEDTSMRDAALALRPDLPAMVFGSFYAPFPPNLKQVLVWPKPPDAGVVGSTTGFRRDAEPVFLVGPWPLRTIERSSVLPPGAPSMKSVTIRNPGHPHVKPVGLMRHLLKCCPAGVVVDPFAGSGATLEAAAQLGRAAIGIEVDERYCELAARRFEQGTFDVGDAA